MARQDHGAEKPPKEMLGRLGSPWVSWVTGPDWLWLTIAESITGLCDGSQDGQKGASCEKDGDSHRGPFLRVPR